MTLPDNHWTHRGVFVLDTVRNPRHRVRCRAELVHQILRRKPDADLSGWATHRRQRAFGGELVRVGGEEARRG